MHSMVFMQFKKFVIKEFGHGPWIKISQETGFDNLHSSIGQTYPDGDFFRLFSKTVEKLGLEKEVALEKFGTSITPFLLQFYEPPTSWGLFDFLEVVETEIHKAVRHTTPYADPAQLIVKRLDKTRIEIFYDSPRGIPWFGLGIIKGLIDHFDDQEARVDLKHLGGLNYLYTISK